VYRVSRFPSLPENKKVEDGCPMLSHLDCAVIEVIHQYRQDNKEKPFDSVRAMFPEEMPIYENSGFLEKNHIQICVRNPNCIKGYFRLLDTIPEYSLP